MAHDTTTQVLSDFTGVTATTTTTAGAEAVARTTSVSALVDEVLPHNDSVSTTTMLHAKAIDINGNLNKKYNNSEDFAQLIERKLQEEHKAALASESSTVYAAASPNRLLSRKRRYLIFPEGSSFQLGKSVSSWTATGHNDSVACVGACIYVYVMKALAKVQSEYKRISGSKQTKNIKNKI